MKIFNFREACSQYASMFEEIHNILTKYPATTKELAMMLNISKNGVYFLIHLMRRRGVPIVKTDKGYFITNNRDKINKECQYFRKIGGGYFKTAKSLKNAPSGRCVQMPLFL